MSGVEWGHPDQWQGRDSAKREANLRAEVERLREALFTAQGEAYLGLLEGDDTPTPLEACQNVVAVCVASTGEERS